MHYFVLNEKNENNIQEIIIKFSISTSLLYRKNRDVTSLMTGEEKIRVLTHNHFGETHTSAIIHYS